MGLVYLVVCVSSPECSHFWGSFSQMAAETVTFITYKNSLPLLNIIVETQPQVSNKDKKKKCFLVVVGVLHRQKFYW